MSLSAEDLAALVDFRHALHRLPEVSGQEVETAARVVAALTPFAPTRIETGLGGHGVAAIWGQGRPAVMLRAELDALPITETGTPAHRSTIPGTGHLCGHDGHMAILLGLARHLHRHPPARTVMLMFQPAEEDGSGAAAVMADPRWPGLRPDWAFALHNYPGIPQGTALLAPGPVNCASEGLKITLTGKTAHASLPQTGLSPAPALARLIPALTALGPGGALSPDYRLVTVTHARLGAPAFGIAPGEAELWVTLRTLTDAPMAALRAEAMALAMETAQAQGLTATFTHHDRFAASVNHPEATARLAAALDAAGFAHAPDDLPMRASEDFGRFGAASTKSAMVFLGAGETHPALHNPDYDFPDALIPHGVALFLAVLAAFS